MVTEKQRHALWRRCFHDCTFKITNKRVPKINCVGIFALFVLILGSGRQKIPLRKGGVGGCKIALL